MRAFFCQNQVLRTWTSNYIQQHRWNTISCPCPWCTLLSHKSPIMQKVRAFNFCCGSMHDPCLLTWISNHIHYKAWDEFIYTFPKFTGAIIEVWERISNIIPYFSGPVHYNVLKWKHFPRFWPFVGEIHRSPVNSPHKGQWSGTLMFSLIHASMNSWVNNREAGDLRRHHAHYDVTVM